MKVKYSSFFSLLFSSAIISPAFAQITTDGSTNTNLTPTDSGVRIDDGDRAGGNLFHSFGEFSVPRGSEAFFNNANDISNIFSRVTGGNISNIDGLIRANGAANLFLINPHGILFGENASLNIGGSFYGSTADSILFPDGIEFSATNTQRPILTINAPIGLNLRDNPGEIVNRSVVENNTDDAVGLEVAQGETLSLVGGNIHFESGQATARSGDIELGGLRNAGTVTLNDDGSLSFPLDVARADITLNNGADIDVRGTGGGSITINGRNVSLSGGNFFRGIRAGITADSTSAEAKAGDININATEITVDGSFIFNDVETGARGNAGNIAIDTTNLTLTNGRINSIFGEGNGGNITIDTTNLTLTNFGEILSIGEGNGGNITIDTTNLTLTNAGFITSIGGGNGGNITIDTTNLTLTNGQITSSIGEGNGGNITIDTTNLTLTNGGLIRIFGEGNITIDTTNLTLTNGAILSDIFGEGNGGNITIDTTNLTLTNGQITSSIGEGNGGNITIDTTNLTLTNGAILSGIFGEGNGGNITIDTTNLTLTNGGFITSSIFGEGNGGNGGNITIDTTNLTLTNGGFITSSSIGEGNGGNGGNITIDTTNLTLTNGGFITSSIFGEGNVGEIQIKAEDTVTLNGEGMNEETTGIFSMVESTSEGNSGSINITTGSLFVTNNARISVQTRSEAKAGTLEINANELVEVSGIGSGLFSRTGGTGDAGNINITTPELRIRDNAQIGVNNFIEIST